MAGELGVADQHCLEEWGLVQANRMTFNEILEIRFGL
jgi:hypothetical protein